MVDKKHKHYNCIVAWAEGKEIEFYHTGSQFGSLNPGSPGWKLCTTAPSWNENVRYRVKAAGISLWANIYIPEFEDPKDVSKYRYQLFRNKEDAEFAASTSERDEGVIGGDAAGILFRVAVNLTGHV